MTPANYAQNLSSRLIGHIHAGRFSVVDDLIMEQKDLVPLLPSTHVDYSVLHQCCRLGLSSTLSRLVEHGVNIHAQSEGKTSAIHIAALHDQPEIAEILINSGVNHETCKTEDGFSPIMIAAESGNATVTRVLLKHGCVTGEERDAYVWGLVIGAMNGHTDVVHQLLAAGVDPNKYPPHIASTALHYAAHSDNEDMAKILLNFGADPAAKNSEGWDSVHIACMADTIAVAAILLSHPNTPGSNSAGPGDVRPLHICAQGGNLDLTKLVLSHGADVNAKDAEGLSPTDYAESESHSEIAALLSEHGAIST